MWGSLRAAVTLLLCCRVWTLYRPSPSLSWRVSSRSSGRCASPVQGELHRRTLVVCPLPFSQLNTAFPAGLVSQPCLLSPHCPHPLRVFWILHLRRVCSWTHYTGDRPSQSALLLHTLSVLALPDTLPLSMHHAGPRWTSHPSTLRGQSTPSWL